jgi:hypothetical protein
VGDGKAPLSALRGEERNTGTRLEVSSERREGDNEEDGVLLRRRPVEGVVGVSGGLRNEDGLFVYVAERSADAFEECRETGIKRTLPSGAVFNPEAAALSTCKSRFPPSASIWESERRTAPPARSSSAWESESRFSSMEGIGVVGVRVVVCGEGEGEGRAARELLEMGSRKKNLKSRLC